MPVKFTPFIFTIVLSFASVHWAFAIEENPCERGDAKGFEECAERAFLEADKELANVYRDLLSLLPDKSLTKTTVTKSSLITAQKSWLKSVQLNCGIQGALTLAPNQWTNRTIDWCKTNQSLRRIEELRSWLGCAKGEYNEGGAVCGSL